MDLNPGLCHRDAATAAGDADASPPLEPDPARTVHAVDFGNDAAAYPVGPFTSVVALDRSYLCATVPEDNDSRPFLPGGAEDETHRHQLSRRQHLTGAKGIVEAMGSLAPNSPSAAAPGAAG